MFRTIKLLFLYLLLFNLIGVSPVSATELKGIDFSPSFETEGALMELKGVALKRVFFMKAFVAGFYLKENISTANVFDNVPKRIEVSYFVDIPGEKLSNYTEELMQKNTTSTEFELMGKRIIAMREYFVDLQAGDRFSLTYIPQIGTKFEYNGELIGIIEGQDFANGLFSTWVGDNPMDHKLKKEILG